MSRERTTHRIEHSLREEMVKVYRVCKLQEHKLDPVPPEIEYDERNDEVEWNMAVAIPKNEIVRLVRRNYCLPSYFKLATRGNRCR